jgi:restriction system protein
VHSQAARSGRQNIAEGNRAAASSQTELRLTHTARASLDELLLDFEDFLGQRGRRQWDKDDPEALAVRAVGAQKRTDQTDQTDPAKYSKWLSSRDTAVVANTLIWLIHQTNYLLDRQTQGGSSGAVQAFPRAGGRGNTTDQSDRTDPTDSARSRGRRHVPQ